MREERNRWEFKAPYVVGGIPFCEPSFAPMVTRIVRLMTGGGGGGGEGGGTGDSGLG